MTREPRSVSTEKQFDRLLGTVLRTGVLISAAVVAWGGVVHLSDHAVSLPDYHVFRGERADLRSVSGIISDAKALDGRGLIQLGVLVLIATPIARVVFSVFGFARQRDWLYVGVTVIVLMLLTYSVTTGGAVSRLLRFHDAEPGHQLREALAGDAQLFRGAGP